MKLTESQQKVVDYVKEGKNVIVSAVAGSGKTHTLLAIGRENPDKRVLCLTYSKFLKDEGREKTGGIHNMEYTNFHSFVYKYSGGMKTFDDVAIRTNINYLNGIQNRWDVIAVDEVQDMKSDYFLLFCKLVKANPNASLVVVGDPMQAIYETLDSLPSDSRYLTMMDACIDKPFERVMMDESFRYGVQVCKMVGRGRPGLDTLSTEVRSIGLDGMGVLVKRLLTQGYKKEDIMVISNAPKNLAYEFANFEKDYPLYVSNNVQDQGNDLEFRKNKIEVMTVHKSKGLERPVVIYIEVPAGRVDEWDEHKERIIDYVAKTRCKQKLFVAKTERRLRQERQREMGDFAPKMPGDVTYGISSLVSYQYEPYFVGMRFREMDSGYTPHELQNKMKRTHSDGDTITENISVHIEYATKRSVFQKEYPSSLHSYLKECGIPVNNLAFTEQSFVDEEIARRMKDMFAGSEANRNIEYPVTTKIDGEYFEGTIDLIDHVNKIVWEYKIGNSPYTLDDRLQIICYKAMTPNLAEYEFRLANIASDKWLVLENTTDECINLMLEAVRRKLQTKVDDETFLKEAEKMWKGA